MPFPETRKPIRRDPEKRRLQNMKAQRKHREKIRERIEYLEATAVAAHIVQLRIGSNHVAHAVGDARREATTNSLGSTPSDVFELALTVTGSSPSGSGAGTGPATPTLTVGENQSVAIHSQSLSPPSPLSAMELWDSVTLLDPSFYRCNTPKDDLDSHWTTTVDCGCCSKPHHIQVRTQSPNPLSYGKLKIVRFDSPSPVTPSSSSSPFSSSPWTTADPYANALRIDTLCTTAALYSLSLHIGITEEIMCAEDSVSPFFRPSADPDLVDNSALQLSTVDTVQRLFQTLKPDLRPGVEQVTIRHHPMFDMLPFPTLRRNLILHQTEIDEDELFTDLLKGLVCWGGAGVGRIDREADVNGHVSSGTPWDGRSWEGKTWFLRKYWNLLGGKDGELVKQSTWWRGLRGQADALEM